MLIEFRGKRPRVAATAFIAPTAVLIGDVEVGEESSVWFGVVIRGDNGPIRIGPRSSVQDNSVLHVSVDCATIVGADCTVGHSVTMEDCTIGDRSVIGSNTVILNGAAIGERCLIGAGSVVGVNAEIPAESVVAGVPAVVKKKLEGAAREWVNGTAEKYVALAQAYLHHGLGDPEMQESIETSFAP